MTRREGWQVAAVIAIWLMPIVGLSLFARYRPGGASLLLAALLVVVAGVFFTLAGWLTGPPDVESVTITEGR